MSSVNSNKFILSISSPIQSEDISKIETTISSLKDVLWCKVDTSLQQISILVKNSSIVLEIVDALKKINYAVETVKKSFPVMEMACASCASSVEEILNNTPGVLHSSVNYASQSTEIEYVPSIVHADLLKKVVQDGGYDLYIDEKEDELEELQSNKIASQKNQLIATWILAFPLLIIGMFFMNMPYGDWIMFALSTPIVLYFGRQFFIGAWKQLKHKSANMDTLIALSAGIAYTFSVFNMIFPEFWQQRGLHGHVYFEAAGVVIAFVLLGKYLEESAKNQAKSSIKKLMGLQPKSVHFVNEKGQVEEKKISLVQVGDILLAKPGEQVAVDGIVKSGSSYINESMISGEPLPLKKEKGSEVFAGTINQNGSFQYEAQKVGSDTVLARIIRMVEVAQGSKAPVQKLVDKIASVFVPIVILIAVLSFVIWALVGGEQGVAHGFMAFVTVLVIACPCALGLATPTALMVGMGKGAELGILIKDAQSLEIAHQIDRVVLDKTGTITEGQPSVQAINWISPELKEKYLSLLYSIEQSSEHPLAQAIVDKIKSEADFVEGLEIENVTGQGIQAIYENERLWIGNNKLLQKSNVAFPDSISTWVNQQEELAHTVVFFFSEHQLLSVISISDQIKSSSLSAVQQLQKMNIEVTMLTGDHQRSADAVASQVGIKNVKAQVLPEEKFQYVADMQSRGHIVAMVGDGVNDSSALAKADISIAMGHGSDIAMDVAKMMIVSSDLKKIPTAIRLSKMTVQTIRQNLFWAFIYNMIGIPIAAGILYPIYGFMLNPMWAGAAMAMSSVSVVLNSLRLKNKKVEDF
ncbi:MAG TPA: heavy metal translocating P-type ATPase [Chitinophagales bacterium]|nr:heavy metal translocating P-type ATPase [Chitinophagales bacterium]